METKLLVFIAIACAVSCVKAVNYTVTSQSPNITRNGCGTSKLCFTLCDPVANFSTCYFGSSKLDGSSLFFELAGPSTGFVALGLASSATTNSSIVFLCGNSSNNLVFLTAIQNNITLNVSADVNTVGFVSGLVNNISSLNQSIIQCTFNTSTTLTTKALTPYFVRILSGTMNGNVPLEIVSSPFTSDIALDLSNPKANSVSTTTAPPTQAATTAGSNSLFSPAARALAILLSATGLLLLY